MKALVAGGCLLLACAAWAQASAPGGPAEPAALPPPKPAPTPLEAKRPEDAPVISRQERLLPGGEPHSPSTWGRAFTDPRNYRRAPGSLGGLGLMRVDSANLGTPGLIRFSAYGDLFLSRDFPEPAATTAHSTATFAVSYAPSDFLEASLAYRASANINSLTSPQLLAAVGDLALGFKLVHQWAPGFHAGLQARFLSFAGVSSQDVRGYGLGFAPSLLITYDLRALTPNVPLLAHLNAGYVFDGTNKELVRQQMLTASEELALGISLYDRVTVGAGVEVPLPVVTPFAEYTLAAPVGVPDTGLVAPDASPVPVAEAMPQRVGLGLRVTAIQDLTITAGGELGLTPRVGLGVPATPPYNLFLAVSYEVDPAARGETRVVETVRERTREVPPPPKTARVEGVVLDSTTRKPVPGAIVTMVGAGLPPVATAPDTGRFLTHELPFGPVRLSASKDGYTEASRELTVELGKHEAVELALEPVPKKARLLLAVSEGKKKIPATVAMSGAQDQQVQVPEGSSDPVPVEVVPGHYQVQVTSPGHLAQAREVEISENAELPLQFDLQPEPKKRLVVVEKDQIQILQHVHFAFGAADILTDSGPLLAQVVDAIVSNDVRKIRIEGHTDNKGDKDVNLKLSQDRAAAVADWLVKAGIDRSRLETAGYGDTRPAASNDTARGRELNRRVEFLIIER